MSGEGASNQTITTVELISRIKWLIKLRWAAFIGVFATVTIAHFVLNLQLALVPLYAGNALLGIYNLAFLFYSRLFNAKKGDGAFAGANRFANVQISADLIMLSVLVYFSGGTENPFIFYFVFHMVIAGILLSNRAAYFQASLAVILLSAIALGTYARVFPYYGPGALAGANSQLNPYYQAGVLSVFASTLFISVYMTTSIVNKLREKENDLQSANAKLEAQDQLKSQYVLTVSHDLQASLSTVQGCLNVVLNNMTGPISDKSREMVTRAEQRTRYLLYFVKDLLDLSRIRAVKQMQKKQVSVSEMLKKAVEQVKFKAEEKKLTLAFLNSADGAPLLADPDAMEQMFTNLAVNAVKYTPWGGKVEILLKEEAGAYQAVVADTGIGISQSDIPHIYEDFFRGKNAEQIEKDGTGLGLSIVKQIFKMHGGSISVESEIGKGTRFILTLPKTAETPS